MYIQLIYNPFPSVCKLLQGDRSCDRIIQVPKWKWLSGSLNLRLTGSRTRQWGLWSAVQCTGLLRSKVNCELNKGLQLWREKLVMLLLKLISTPFSLNKFYFHLKFATEKVKELGCVGVGGGSLSNLGHTLLMFVCLVIVFAVCCYHPTLSLLIIFAVDGNMPCFKVYWYSGQPNAKVQIQYSICCLY